ncbi:MAG TPA: hypothetical protein VF228_17090 [Iamia sp.]
MGYDLHITRTDDWTQSADDPITLDEWLALASASVHVEEDGRVTGGDVTPFHLVADPDGPNLYWYEDGRVVVRGVETSSFPHLVDLAAELGAKVVGDDGEHYRTDGTTFEPDVDAPDAREQQPTPRRRWWRGRPER